MGLVPVLDIIRSFEFFWVALRPGNMTLYLSEKTVL